MIEASPLEYLTEPREAATVQGMLLIVLTAVAAPRFPVTQTTPVLGGPGMQMMGYGFAVLGDLDGDGYGEAAFGGTARYGQPGVTLVEGAADGVDSATSTRLGDPADLLCCWSITAGDLDGDGSADLVVGDVSDQTPGNLSAFRVLRGSSAGVELTASATVWDPLAQSRRSTWGTAQDFLGDIDGDGDEELGAGMTTYFTDQPGELHIFDGGSSAPSAGADQVLMADDAHTQYGLSLAGVRDTNGDGLDDFVVGNPTLYFPDDSGRAYLYGNGSPPELLAVLTVEGVSEEFATVVAAGGDVNGDGYADVLSPDPRNCDREDNMSALYVFFGATEVDPADHQAVRCMDVQCDAFAADVDGVGDIDGDGFDDVVTGNASYNSRNARLYPGGSAGLDELDTLSLASSGVDVWYSDYVGPAGDLDADGWPDFFVADTSFDLQAGMVDVWMRPHEGGSDSGIGDSGDTAGPDDTDEPDDTAVGAPDDSAVDDTDDVFADEDTGGADKTAGCGCSAGSPHLSLGLLTLGLVWRRRSRSGGDVVRWRRPAEPT